MTECYSLHHTTVNVTQLLFELLIPPRWRYFVKMKSHFQPCSPIAWGQHQYTSSMDAAIQTNVPICYLQVVITNVHGFLLITVLYLLHERTTLNNQIGSQ